jgi:hypothetical protein
MKTAFLAASSLVVLLGNAALASQSGSFEQRACMIEGTLALFGQKIYSKDCLQASPQEKNEAEFRKTCSDLANTSALMGGKAGTITYQAQCETPAQGICRNLMGSGRDAYYYARSDNDLASLPASCELLQGKWVPGQ